MARTRLRALVEESVDSLQRGERTSVYRACWDVQVHGQFAHRDPAVMQRHEHVTLFPVEAPQRFLDQGPFQGAFDLPDRFGISPVRLYGMRWASRLPLNHETQSGPPAF
jgi:hypothetical protein